MYKIFIAEDDEIISGVIKKHIEGWGFDVRCVSDFKNLLSEFSEFAPHLVLLDISLPFYNGYHWCEQIRKISKVPVIFISSAAENMNIVMAVSLGADDFIAKPFDLSVLTAKIQAILRRTYDFSGKSSSIMEHNGVFLNIGECTVLYNGNKTELSKNENKILSILFENAGTVVSRETIMNSLWETDSFIDENTLSVNIARLRKKLCEAGIPDIIRTKKGIGYMVI